MQISVMLSNFHQPFEKALELAAGLGIAAVEISLSPGDDAQSWNAKAKAAAAAGLAVSAICVDVGDLGGEDALARVEAAQPWLEAAAIGQGICQTHVGIMPYGTTGERWDRFVRACSLLAERAHALGSCVALETGPEPARVMEKMMKTVDSPGLRVNYDPANFVIWPAVLAQNAELAAHTGASCTPYDKEKALELFEPVEGVNRLAPYIVHTHAKDGIGNGGWADVPLGTGWIDWPRYLGLLQSHGYDGYLCIEREGGNDPTGEIALAAQFLREQLRLLSVKSSAS